MRMYDIILKKRKGLELSTEEIEFFVNGFTKGEVPDYQASALLMAIFFNKMNKRETADLTMAMVNSGDKIDLSSINGVKVDKHSTGGVGDKSNAIGIALTGQTGNSAPAEKKIYALRDVTATVDNMSLIASSIMSKKIASGADAIVLDVKVGDGAFMKTPEDAKALAREMVDIGSSVGRKTIGVISDMDQPLGYAIGNSLEVKEAIELLKGNGPKDLLELTLTLGSYMLVCGKTARNFEEGKALLLENINNGKGLEKLKEFVKAQGGDASLIDDTDKFPKAKYVVEVKAAKSGVISKINAEAFGLIAMELGAGRETKESIIDLSVGIVLNKKRGEVVKEGDILAYIHSNDESNIEKAKNDIIKNMIISNSLDKEIPLIYDIVE